MKINNIYLMTKLVIYFNEQKTNYTIVIFQPI